MRYLFAGLLVTMAFVELACAQATPNTWRKLEKAVITGKRWDIPVSYDPVLKRFLVLGGRTTFGEYKKPRSYDVLALDEAQGQWEN